ncbi:hypothetical protein [Acinetobacter pragensis]|uniref:hypothetical protein n=1 Tax=Acinetobacter pragensis TaxID=1806892 RepID=UPI00334287A0
MGLDELYKIAGIVGSGAVIFIGYQLRLSYTQFKADHERSRREKSVEILIEWSRNLKKEGSLARKIVECFSEEQCRELVNQQEIKIDIKYEKLLVHLFGIEEVFNKANEIITLSVAQSVELRWHVISYLNSLEFCLVAWQNAIVDKIIIETQFDYLFRPSDGHEVLKNFRKAAGGENSYPAIEVFTAHLVEKRRQHLVQKANVG